MKRTNILGDAHTIGIIIFTVIVVGVLCFAAFENYIDSAKRNVDNSVNNDKTAEEMQRVVKNDMRKSEIDVIIGAPHECDEARAVKIDDEMREIRRCSYGNPNAGSYLNVTYMDDKVWGTSYEEGGEK